jgi:hypothetical protein
VYTKVGSACTGACLLERKKDGGPGTQVARLRELLRRLVLWAPSATPDPPSEVLPRILGVSPPPEHLLHECINESHGCIRMNATCSVNAMWTTTTLMLYSIALQHVQISSPVEKYLPNLLNVIYSCSSLVKDLTPKQSTRTTLLKLTQTQAQYSTTPIWTAAKYFNNN